MLNVQGIDVNIGATPILRGVSLEVPSGTMCGLIGRNGAGKTTFMRAVMGALEAKTGGMEFNGENLREAPAHRRAHVGIGFMPDCLLYTSPSPRDGLLSRMPSSA